MKTMYTFLLLLSIMLTGCSQALLFNNGLYSHTVEPLTFNRETTEVARCEKTASGSINQFQYPFTAFGIRIGKTGLGLVAKEHGITTIYFADLERRSFLFGIWSRERVHVYGR